MGHRTVPTLPWLRRCGREARLRLQDVDENLDSSGPEKCKQNRFRLKILQPNRFKDLTSPPISSIRIRRLQDDDDEKHPHSKHCKITPSTFKTANGITKYVG